MKSPAFKEAEEALRVAYNMLLYVENDRFQPAAPSTCVLGK